MKRFNYLLGQTELFQHFIDIKVSVTGFQAQFPNHPKTNLADAIWSNRIAPKRDRDPEFAAMLAAEEAKKDGKGKKKAM
jgi:hypothetical protein